MAYQDDVLAVLRAIDASLKELLALQRTALPKPVAPDRDLDSEWGNPLVKFNPRDWTGESCKGRRFSECPAPFLELLAETFDYFGREAEKKHEQTDKGKPVAPYKYRDAARARGWAKRIRDGYAVPTLVGTSEWGSENGDGDGQESASPWATDDGIGF